MSKGRMVRVAGEGGLRGGIRMAVVVGRFFGLGFLVHVAVVVAVVR